MTFIRRESLYLKAKVMALRSKGWKATDKKRSEETSKGEGQKR
jgi:hypothetical protein